MSYVIYYSIENIGEIKGNLAEFSQNAARTLNDPRGWSLGGLIKFIQYPRALMPPPDQRDLRIILASAESVSKVPGCSGQLSCQYQNCVFINDDRWCFGPPNRPDVGENPLDEYHQYVLNHEVGHWFGLEHVNIKCPGVSSPAPVMKQQSRGLDGCIPTTWPLEYEKCEVARILGVNYRACAIVREYPTMFSLIGAYIGSIFGRVYN